MPDLQIKSRADHDRLRQRVAAARRLDKKISFLARKLVVEYLQGRSGDACMADLAKAAREAKP